YYVHNINFVAYARWMQGRKSDGIKAADEMGAAMAPMLETMPDMADGFNAVCIFGRVRFQDWDSILKLPQPKDAVHATTATWHYARALAFAGKGDRTAAAREQAAFDDLRAHIPPDTPWGTNNKAKDVAELASEIIAARVSASPVEAVPHWQHAVAI